MDCSCVGCTMFLSYYRKNCKSWVCPYVLQTSNAFGCPILTFGCLCLNQYHQLLPGIPFQNGVTLVCVRFATFIFSCYKLMDNPHSSIANVHTIIVASSSSIRTLPGPIFLYLVFPFKWSEMELIGMFHALLAFRRENVPLSITSIINSKDSFVHMPLLVIEGTRFNCVDFLLCGS